MLVFWWKVLHTPSDQQCWLCSHSPGRETNEVLLPFVTLSQPDIKNCVFTHTFRQQSQSSRGGSQTHVTGDTFHTYKTLVTYILNDTGCLKENQRIHESLKNAKDKKSALKKWISLWTAEPNLCPRLESLCCSVFVSVLFLVCFLPKCWGQTIEMTQNLTVFFKLQRYCCNALTTAVLCCNMLKKKQNKHKKEKNINARRTFAR